MSQPIDIAAFRALHGASTQGTWFHNQTHDCIDVEGDHLINRVADTPSGELAQIAADFDFIATIHNGLPGLLDRLERFEQAHAMADNAIIFKRYRVYPIGKAFTMVAACDTAVEAAALCGQLKETTTEPHMWQWQPPSEAEVETMLTLYEKACHDVLADMVVLDELRQQVADQGHDLELMHRRRTKQQNDLYRQSQEIAALRRALAKADHALLHFDYEKLTEFGKTEPLYILLRDAKDAVKEALAPQEAK